MAPPLKPIEPKTLMWEPANDPHEIPVPGLDTTAPPYDQIEQIEQLITIKLQTIDANFSKMQHIMANRILPAVKRYAVGTQPVREAAKFWTTFYEQAAEIRIPTYEDYGSVEQSEVETTQPDDDQVPARNSVHMDSDSDREGVETSQGSRMFNGDKTSSDVSFAPGQAAISSTPATVSRARSMRTGNESFASHASDAMPSWSASLESPIRQLNRDIQNLTDEHSIASSSDSNAYDISADITQRPTLHSTTPKESSTRQSVDKGKSREGSTPLLQNVLRKNANTSAVSTVSGLSSHTTPLRFKPKTPTIKTLNPYLPPDSNPSDWEGIVDLKDPSVSSPQKREPGSAVRILSFKPAATAFKFERPRAKTPPDDDDDTIDGNFGMSPPVMTDYARLPKLGRTPKKEAAERIMHGLVELEQRRTFAPSASSRQPMIVQAQGGAPTYGTESSMSSMPSPPSMTRYNRSGYSVNKAHEASDSVTDSSLDSMMRRVGLEIPEYSAHYAPHVSTTAPASPPAPAPVPTRPTVSHALPTASVLPSRPPVFSVEPVFSADPAASLASLRSLSSASSLKQPSPPVPRQPEAPRTPEVLQPPYDFYDDEVAADPNDSLDSVDSFDQYQDPDAHAAHFMFTADRDDLDDSFDSSLADDEELMMTDGTGGPLQELMHGAVDGAYDGFDDDSFDDDNYGGGEGETETVFGVPPNQRLQREAAQAGQLRMMGGEQMQDTIGLEQQFARAGWVQETPTPWNAGGRG